MASKNKIFLAGSTGMVGTGILKHILKTYPSKRVKALYHDRKPFIKDKRIEYIRGDLENLKSSHGINIKDCDYAIMAASKAGGANFVKKYPWAHMNRNLLMNMALLNLLHSEKIKRIIFIGSSAIYQEFYGTIYEFDINLNEEPHDDYFGFGWSMRFIEKICKFMHLKYGTEIILIRAANIFGPHDKFNPEVSNFIPALIRKAVDKIDPFKVWGRPDVVRDVLYIEDFARAVMMLADANKIKFDTFNVGSDRMTKVQEVVNLILKHTGHSPKNISYTQNKLTTIKLRLLSSAKIFNFIGWESGSSTEEGIKQTINWWKENKKRWKI